MAIELVTFVSKKEDLMESELMMLLEKARTSKFLHPLVVLEILSRNDRLRVTDIKEYIVDWLEEQNALVRLNMLVVVIMVVFRSETTRLKSTRKRVRSHDSKNAPMSYKTGELMIPSRCLDDCSRLQSASVPDEQVLSM